MATAQQMGRMARIGSSDEGAVHSVTGSHFHAAMLEVIESKHRHKRVITKVFLRETMVAFCVSEEFRVTGGKASELTVDEIVVVVLGVGITSGEDVHFLILSQLTFHPLIVISIRKAHQIRSPIRKESIRHDQPTTPMEKLPLSRSNTTKANEGSEEAFNTGTPTSITVSSLLAGLYGILQADTGSSNTSCSPGPAKSNQDSNLRASDRIDIGGMIVWEQREVCCRGSLVSVHLKATCDGVV